MATMRDIKRRKASIESTEQITKAMKLVATVKLQKSRAKAENSKLYFNVMYETIQQMLKKSRGIEHEYLRSGASKKKAIVVITSNRGLAGGYNANIVRLVAGSGIPVEDAKIFAVGRKGRDGLLRKGYEITADHSEVINEPLFSDAVQITKELLKLFEQDEIGEIYLAYTSFKNTVSQIPTFMKLLPVDLSGGGKAAYGGGTGAAQAAVSGGQTDVSRQTASGSQTDAARQDAAENGGNASQDLLLMNYEPDETEVLDEIIPKYISSLIYGAFLEAVASENGARMTAMDSATNNAEEMIGKLSLQYNRARQGSITQELTEIIAGANAIEG